MKKLIAMFLSLVMVLSLGACAAKETPKPEADPKPAETTTPETKPDEEKEEKPAEETIGGTLTIWEHTPQFEESLNAVVEGFNELYPDVKIETSVKSTDQYYNLLQTAMQAGEAPDLFWTNGNATTNYGAYVEQGLMMELTDKVDFSLYEGNGAMSIVTLEDGSIYSTPTAETGGRAVFYNKDIFEENGLEIPTTFEEFEQILATLAETDTIPIALGTNDPWNILFIYEPIQAAMALDWIQEYEKDGYAEVNDPRVVAAYDKLLEWGDKGYFGPNWTGATGSGATLAFSSGQAAMYIGGTWSISTFQENNPALNFGAFQIPTSDGQRPFVSTFSCGLGVSSKTQNEPAAIAFANYFASQEGQSRWLGALNAISCVPSVVSENDVVNDIQNSYDVVAKSYYDILGAQAGTGDSPCNVWEEDQLKVLTGSLSVQDFVDSLQALCVPREEFLANK